jgi:hypothetical protein
LEQGPWDPKVFCAFINQISHVSFGNCGIMNALTQSVNLSG